MPSRGQLEMTAPDHEENRQVAKPARATVTISDYPVTSVRIDSLAFKGSPRLAGANPEHARMLAETGADLPAILVHRPTMQVIDGVHRVQAALIKGKTVIDARLLDCDEATAFVLAVKANVTHGLPLTQADRRAAAARIVHSHPHWSDRLIALSTGLSDKTISVLRARSTAENPTSDTRRGKDGRERPINPSARRRHAAELINRNPGTALREVARATGLSPATVRDVWERIKRHEDPVPAKYLGDQDAVTLAPASQATAPTIADISPGRTGRVGGGRTNADTRVLLAKLSNDPSLKLKEAGRRTLHWLRQHVVDSRSCGGLVDGVPDHCAPVVANLARSCATAWVMLAEELEERSAAQ